jgi:serine/threonine protein kinase
MVPGKTLQQLFDVDENLIEDLLNDRELDYEGVSPMNVTNITYSLLTSIDILHRLHIYHRDIKPDNIIYDAQINPQAVLIDFDFACRKECHGVPGTYEYSSTLKLEGKIRHEREWARSDIVSVALTIYRLLTGDTITQTPDLTDRDEEELLENIIESEMFDKYLPILRFILPLLWADVGYDVSLSEIIQSMEETFQIDSFLQEDYRRQLQHYGFEEE